jgi:hypothetical protein
MGKGGEFARRHSVFRETARCLYNEWLPESGCKLLFEVVGMIRTIQFAPETRLSLLLIRVSTTI